MESTVIILAGGKSSRMGTNKALLSLNGKTNIENQLDEAKKISRSILIVTNQFDDYAFLGVPLVEDKRKGFGPLAGLEAGLAASTTENNLLVACDMPFFNADAGTELLNRLTEFQAVMPHVGGKLHPLFAAYRKSILPVVEEALNHNHRRMASLLDKMNAKILYDKEFSISGQADFERYFYNMNRPEEYDLAKQFYQK